MMSFTSELYFHCSEMRLFLTNLGLISSEKGLNASSLSIRYPRTLTRQTKTNDVKHKHTTPLIGLALRYHARDDSVFYLRIKIWFFDVHPVMKPVGGAKIPWSAKRFLNFSDDHWLHHSMNVKKSNFNSYICLACCGKQDVYWSVLFRTSAYTGAKLASRIPSGSRTCRAKAI